MRAPTNKTRFSFVMWWLLLLLLPARYVRALVNALTNRSDYQFYALRMSMANSVCVCVYSLGVHIFILCMVSFDQLFENMIIFRIHTISYVSDIYSIEEEEDKQRENGIGEKMSFYCPFSLGSISEMKHIVFFCWFSI